MSSPDGGQPLPSLPADHRPGSSSEAAPQPPDLGMAEQHLLGGMAAHASAASLSRLELPLSPVVAPPVGSPRGTAAEANAASPRSPHAAGLSLLRTHSSRPLSVAALRRPGTEVSESASGGLDRLGSPGCCVALLQFAMGGRTWRARRRSLSVHGCIFSVPAHLGPRRLTALLFPAAPIPRSGRLVVGTAASWVQAGRRMPTRRSWYRVCRAGMSSTWPPALCTPPP